MEEEARAGTEVRVWTDCGTLAVMTINVSALVLALLGAVVFVVSPNASAKELGRIAFFVGLFWFAARLAAGSITLR